MIKHEYTYGEIGRDEDEVVATLRCTAGDLYIDFTAHKSESWNIAMAAWRAHIPRSQ